jgi:hypothetical protein
MPNEKANKTDGLSINQPAPRLRRSGTLASAAIQKPTNVRKNSSAQCSEVPKPSRFKLAAHTSPPLR